MGFIYTKSGKLAKRLYFGAVLLFEGLYYTFKNRVLADGGTFVENELPTISQDASLVLTPNAYKAGKLYSAVPNDGTGDFTVNRNCPATYIDEDGILRTALANVARIDYSSGEAVVLIEAQRINYIKYSSDFTKSVNNGFVLSQGVDFGIASFTKIIATNASSLHRIYRLEGAVVSGNVSVTLFVRKNNYRYVRLNSTSSGRGVTFDFNTESYANINGIALTIKKLPDGIYKIGFIETVASGTNVGYQMSASDVFISNAVTVFQGDGVSGVDIWGAQIEEGSTPTSHIPTNGTTETRLADNISVPTPAGVTSITETIDGVEQTPITTIPATYSLPVGNINKVTML